MARLTPTQVLGFDPTKEPIDLLRAAIEKVRKCVVEPDDAMNDAIDELDSLVESLDEANCLVCWTKIDENDRSTWPTAYEPCLALVSWGKGPSHRFGSMGGSDDESHEAVFYEAKFGEFMLKSDLDGFDDETCDDGDDLVFVLDHGDQMYDAEGEDWIEAPKWWAKIATPQTLQMEFPREAKPDAAP